MPDLYCLYIGPVNAAYYQRQFQRFESAGKISPSWNHGAAFFTLAWLLLRKLWQPAAIYAATLLSLGALWWWGLHGRVPLALEAAACLLTLLLLYVLPGFMGNGLYYHHVRGQTLQTLTNASSLRQARMQLAEQAVTPQRWHAVVAMQALVALAITAAAGWLAPSGALLDPTTPAPAHAISGPPELVIPSVPHLPPLALPPFPPELTEPAAQAAPLAATPDIAAPLPALPALPTTSTTTPSAAAAPAPIGVRPAPASKTAVKTAAPPLLPSSPPAAAKAQTAAMGKYYLNAGVFAHTSNVDAAVVKLQTAQLHTERQTVSSKNGEYTRLRIGPFDTRQQAEKAAAQAKKLRIPTTLTPPPQP